MSQYRFISSSAPLPTVDNSGFVKMTLGKIKKIHPDAQGPVPMDELELPEDTEVLYAHSEADLGGLSICPCDNPPYDLEHYIRMDYVYWLEGNVTAKWVSQLQQYLLENSTGHTSIKLWSIWFGDGIKPIRRIRVPLSRLTVAELDLLEDCDCCIEIFSS